MNSLVSRRTLVSAGLVAAALMLASCVGIGAAAPNALPGDLDPEFGNGGIAVTTFTPTFHSARAVAIQTDGRLIIAGSAADDFAVVRLNQTGSVDTTFGSAGMVTFPVGASYSNATGVAIDSAGRIVVVGWAQTPTSLEFGVARLNSDGSIDSSFGAGGTALVDFEGDMDLAADVGVLPDGSIIVVGRAGSPSGYVFGIAKIAPNGVLDGSFGSGGLVAMPVGPLGYSYASSVQILGGGKIVVAGTADSTSDPSDPKDFALVRLDLDGSLDIGFGTAGVSIADLGFGGADDAADLVVQSDGRLVVGGTSTSNVYGDHSFAVARFTADGALDPEFGFGGAVRIELPGPIGIDTGRAVALDQSGRIVIGGTSEGNFALARLLPDGLRDYSFGQNGQPTLDYCFCDDELNDLLVQPDGKVVAVGHGGGAYDGEPSLTAVRFLGGDLATPTPTPSPTPTPVSVGGWAGIIDGPVTSHSRWPVFVLIVGAMAAIGALVLASPRRRS